MIVTQVLVYMYMSQVYQNPTKKYTVMFTVCVVNKMEERAFLDAFF